MSACDTSAVRAYAAMILEMREDEAGELVANRANRAAADDQRSLTSLIEKLLTDHLRRKGYLKTEGPQSTESHSKKLAQAAKLAEEHVDRLIDPALPPEERERSKRRLIKGPGEFRDIRDRAKGKQEK
jgi:hypothetical protein